MKILVVDDHALFREGLGLLIGNRLNRETEILQASNADQALEMAQPDLDLILLDLYLPDSHPFLLIRQIRERNPGVPVVIVSGSEDPVDIANALSLDVAGYIPKRFTADEIVSALRQVLDGEVFLPEGMRGQVELVMSSVAGSEAAELTTRQREVLQLMAEGLSNKEIARDLDLTEGTVKLHVTSILKTLGVANRTKAILTASRLGLVHPF